MNNLKVLTFTAIVIIAFNNVALGQSQVTDSTNRRASGPDSGEQLQAGATNSLDDSKGFSEKFIEDPTSVLENQYFRQYWAITLIFLGVLVILAILFVGIRKRHKQKQDIKHHTSQPFGHVSKYSVNKAKKNNSNSRVFEPGGNEATNDVTLQSKQVAKQEATNTKEIKIKETLPSKENPSAPEASNGNTQPQEAQASAQDLNLYNNKANEVKQEGAEHITASQQLIPQTMPQSSNQPATVTNSDNPTKEPNPKTQSPTQDSNKAKIIVGDVIEDD